MRHSRPPTVKFPGQALFSQKKASVIGNHITRSDLSVDPTTFALTIGAAQPKDDGFYTCMVFDGTASLMNLYTDILVYSKLSHPFRQSLHMIFNTWYMIHDKHAYETQKTNVHDVHLSLCYHVLIPSAIDRY